MHQLEAVDQDSLKEIILVSSIGCVNYLNQSHTILYYEQELLQQLASRVLTQSEGKTEAPVDELKESNGEETVSSLNAFTGVRKAQSVKYTSYPISTGTVK